ncbi:hypothetical protein ACWD7C_26340 [Streptomyces sp. NPDC005134]|uniref:hypothetical protein n=1 Tax=unclassified Streptomyces TaxID=2593676 RepID=UPI00339F0256
MSSIIATGAGDGESRSRRWPIAAAEGGTHAQAPAAGAPVTGDSVCHPRHEGGDARREEEGGQPVRLDPVPTGHAERGDEEQRRTDRRDRADHRHGEADHQPRRT